MKPIPENHPLKHLFTGLVEHAFQTELGICDPSLASYMSDLLIEFVHVDEMRIARDSTGLPVREIGELIGHWERTDRLPSGATSRFVHRRIGDYTLFWTGIFPEGMRSLAGPSWRDQMVEYVAYGKRSYAIASELTPPDEEPPARLLRQLSEEFESCVHGLGIVRAGLDSPNLLDGGELLY